MTVLACDVGGTVIKLGVVDAGHLLAESAIPARSDRGLAERLPALAHALRDLARAAGIALSSCRGIGMAFPSVMDPRTGRVLASYGKYEDAPGLDLRAWARDALGLPLAIDNDARMALAGEWRHGAGRGSNDLVMITFGTGLGVAAIMEGRILRGAHGQAGVMGGHLTVRHGGRRCHCGNVGCAEAEASTAFLGEVAAARPDFAASALRRQPELDYATVFRLAESGDACARGIVDHTLEVWSALVVSLVHAYDPDRVILGGGIMKSADRIMPPVADYVARHAHTPWGRVRLVASELGGRAALLAGEWLVETQRARDGDAHS